VLDGVDVFIRNYALEATVLLAKSIAEAENVFDHELAF
jgi:hypothetical protein